MSEKQASSEIAERLKKYKAEIFGGKLISIGGIGWQHGDLIQLLELAERDTRERCAQIAEHFLDELTAEEFPPHGLHKATMRWDSGHSEQFVKWVAERIRGKE